VALEPFEQVGGLGLSGAAAPARGRRHVGRARRSSRTYRIGDVVGKAFSVWLANIVPFSILAIVVTSPLLALDLAVVFGGFEVPGGTVILGYTSYDLFYELVSFVLQQFLSATLMFGVFQRLRSRQVSIGDSISRGLSCLGPALGVGLIVTIALGVTALPASLVSLVANGDSLFVLAGGPLSLVAFAYVGSSLIASVPSAVVEKSGVVGALKRSVALTSGSRIDVIGTILLFFLLLSLISIPLGLASGLLSSSVADPNVVMILEALMNAPLQALMAAVIAVIYHDLRVAKEGIDTEELAAVFD